MAWVSATATAGTPARPSGMCMPTSWSGTAATRTPRRSGCGSVPGRARGPLASGPGSGGPGVDPDQADPGGPQHLLAVQYRVLPSEVAPPEPRLRHQARASRAGERGGVQVGAGEAGAVPRRPCDQRRLRVDRGGQVGTHAARESVAGVAVDVRRVLGGTVLVPGTGDHLAVPCGDRAHLAPPVRAVLGDCLGGADELAGELRRADLAVEGHRRLGR